MSLPSTASDVTENVYSLNARETAFFGQNRWLLESAIRVINGDFKENTDLGGGATDEISLLAGGRFWNTNFPLVGAQRTEDGRVEWTEDLSYFTGRHSARFGFHVDQPRAKGFYRTPTLNIIANNALDARYRDLGMDLTNQQSVRVLLPVNGREGYDITNTVYSLYGQDSWQAANGLTVVGGLRWDYESLFPDAKSNFAPRLGITWDPWKDGKTVFRASGGTYYDAGLLGPALLAPELGGSTIGLFSYWSMPRGGAFFNNPALGAFGSLQAGGTRWLANPTLFSYLMPAGTQFSSGGLSITGQGRPNIVYETLGIPVPDPADAAAAERADDPAAHERTSDGGPGALDAQCRVPEPARVPAVLLRAVAVRRAGDARRPARLQVQNGGRPAGGRPEHPGAVQDALHAVDEPRRRATALRRFQHRRRVLLASWLPAARPSRRQPRGRHSLELLSRQRWTASHVTGSSSRSAFRKHTP